MGALKRIYGDRFNMLPENLVLAAKSTFNRPISFWRERDASEIKRAFQRGNQKAILDDRKRRRETTEAEQLATEAKRQKDFEENRKQQANLLAKISDYIPDNLELVILVVNFL